MFITEHSTTVGELLRGDQETISDDPTTDEFEEEEEELEDDGRQRRYDRGYLLSLQFLKQCKQCPPNLMNAEYIIKRS